MRANESWATVRSKTVSWHDPMTGVAEMDGLICLTAMAEGAVPPPPISGLMGVAASRVERGTVVFTCTADESAYNPIGLVHGGLVCTLLDSVLGCAVHTTLARGTGCTSLEIKVSYLRPVWRVAAS